MLRTRASQLENAAQSCGFAAAPSSGVRSVQAVSPALAEGTCVCVLRMEIASFELTNSLIYLRFESMKSLGVSFGILCRVSGTWLSFCF